MTSGTELTPENKEKFLAELRQTANVSHSAKAAGFTRAAAYKNRDRDPDFKAAWEDALEEAIDVLEKEAHRRAFEGCEEPVGFYMGDHGGTFVKKYSDTLAIFLLKAHRPERFRDNLHLSGEVGRGEDPFEKYSDDQIARMYEIANEGKDEGGEETK